MHWPCAMLGGMDTGTLFHALLVLAGRVNQSEGTCALVPVKRYIWAGALLIEHFIFHHFF